MRSRRAPIAFILLLALGVVSAGCFNAVNSGKTVTDAITIASGTVQSVVEPGATGATTGTTATTSTSATTATGTTATTATTATGTTTGTTGTSTTGGQDFTAARDTFKSTCGGCHTLKDAGTNGTVGPNLDTLSPHPDLARIEQQIANGGAVMPAGLLKGAQATAVATYVEAVAGKS
jgi:mono/diheme cytochrome c family protein